MKNKGLIIINAAEVATPVGRKASAGKAMQDIHIIKDGAVVIEDKIIKAVDKTSSIVDKYKLEYYEVIDAEGKCIIPGFVDSHTHFIFGGYRPEEFLMRIGGKSYMEIMNQKGGIQNTVEKTRQSSFEELYDLGLDRLKSMLAFGVTTVEGKSGYGLDFDTEIKQLEVMQKLRENQPIDIKTTYLGAHAVAEEYEKDPEGYIDFMIDKVLPYVAENKLADYCDVFCEKGVFSVEQSRRIFNAAKKLKFGIKVHADEICTLGGAELAAEVGAVSADHLLNASDNGIKKLAESGTIASILPMTAFCLKEEYAPARKMIDEGCAVALASDFNPGSCFSNSIPLIIALACINMKMTMEETLTALTLNGAAAIDMADEIGSIEEGKFADLLLLKYPSYRYLAYNSAINIVDTVIKDGEVVHKNTI